MPSPASSPMAGSSTPASRARPTCSTTPEAPLLLFSLPAPAPGAALVRRLAPPAPHRAFLRRPARPSCGATLPGDRAALPFPSLVPRFPPPAVGPRSTPRPSTRAEGLLETTTQPRDHGGAPERRPKQRWSAEATVHA